MESAKAGAVAGEGKAVTSERFGSVEKAKVAARQKALKRELEKVALVEQTGGASDATEHDAQYRACRW
jgi:hypothetical protein